MMMTALPPFFRWGNWCLHFLKFSRGHITCRWQTPLTVNSQLVSKAHTVLLTIPSDRDFQSPSEVLLWFIVEMFVWLFGTVSENSWSSENWKLWVGKNMMITFTQITLLVYLDFQFIWPSCHLHDSISMYSWWYWGSTERLRSHLSISDGRALTWPGSGASSAWLFGQTQQRGREWINPSWLFIKLSLRISL